MLFIIPVIQIRMSVSCHPLSLSLSKMRFYKKNIHSFVGQTNTKTMPFNDNEILGSLETRDLCGIGFADEANGLTLCTEYLGFESYDMKMSENEVEKKMTCHAEEETERVERKTRKTTEQNVVAPAREGKREFPPPLSSLNGRGQRSYYLRPVRKDGRLELTRVMIDRPEIFHASRENGRLRLHLVNGHTTRKDAICDGNLRGQISVDNPIKAYCDFEEIVDFEEFEDENKGPNQLRLEYDREINKDNNTACDQVVDLSMINDDTAAGSLRYKSNKDVSLNSDDDAAHFDDEHDAGEWRYKNCYKSRNHDENDYHHHHHHIHPYHHYSSNNNMHLWSRSYVKTR